MRIRPEVIKVQKRRQNLINVRHQVGAVTFVITRYVFLIQFLMLFNEIGMETGSYKNAKIGRLHQPRAYKLWH